MNLKVAVYIFLGINVGGILMKNLSEKYNISSEDPHIEIGYLERSLSDLVGPAARLIVEKAMEFGE